MRRLRKTSQTPAAPARPFVLVEAGVHGLTVAAANAPARALGVCEGLRFSDAKARAPDLASEEIDRAADARALKKLCEWTVRIAPVFAVDGRDGLMLETTGCAHLFGGEEGLLETARALLARNGIPAQLALAGTPGAAHALARHRPGEILVNGAEEEGLAALPVAGLRLSEDAQALLRRFGLTRIGQLYGLERKALARRFRSAAHADAVLLRLDQALGRRAEPFAPLRPAPAFAARLSCPEPIGSSEAIASGLETLCRRICADLEKAGEGAQRFTLHAFRADGGKDAVAVATARPENNPERIAGLFRERIDGINPGFGLDLLLLHAERTGPLQISAGALSGDLAPGDIDEAALSALADRIAARLGDGAVKIARHCASHIPERAETRAPFAGSLVHKDWQDPLRGPRPLRLFEPPEPVTVLAEVPEGPPMSFRWRRVRRRVVKADGPERIAPEWWRREGAPPGALSGASFTEKMNRKWLAPKLDPRADAGRIKAARRDLERSLAREDSPQGEGRRAPAPKRPRARDYYRVEDAQGRRYWLCREGLYGDRDGEAGRAPAWFIHGVFP